MLQYTSETTSYSNIGSLIVWAAVAAIPIFGLASWRRNSWIGAVATLLSTPLCLITVPLGLIPLLGNCVGVVALGHDRIRLGLAVWIPFLLLVSAAVRVMFN